MDIKRFLVIIGISLIFIMLFCRDIVEGSEDQTTDPGTMEPETTMTETMEPETTMTETMEPETIMTETMEPETTMTDTNVSRSSENEIDKMIELQMMQMELLKEAVNAK